eukprot:NODE_158_length_15065_cov_0.349125.p1 type:complete len:555 gc:universal NODE_158_length_15065_cov_0.349125:11544-13208(+)
MYFLILICIAEELQAIHKSIIKNDLDAFKSLVSPETINLMTPIEAFIRKPKRQRLYHFNGATPLHIAVKYMRIACIYYLLLNGAELLQNGNGEYPKDLVPANDKNYDFLKEWLGGDIVNVRLRGLAALSGSNSNYCLNLLIEQSNYKEAQFLFENGYNPYASVNQGVTAEDAWIMISQTDDEKWLQIYSKYGYLSNCILNAWKCNVKKVIANYIKYKLDFTVLYKGSSVYHSIFQQSEISANVLLDLIWGHADHKLIKLEYQNGNILHLAAVKSEYHVSLEWFQKILIFCQALDEINADGDTPVFQLIHHMRWDVLKYITGKYPFDLNLKCHDIHYLQKMAMLNVYWEFFQYFTSHTHGIILDSDTINELTDYAQFQMLHYYLINAQKQGHSVDKNGNIKNKIAAQWISQYLNGNTIQIYAVDGKGNTVLHRCATNNNINCLEYFYSIGFDLFQLNHQSASVLYIAVENQSFEFVSQLIIYLKREIKKFISSVKDCNQGMMMEIPRIRYDIHRTLLQFDGKWSVMEIRTGEGIKALLIQLEAELKYEYGICEGK